mmetsp:Transcript_71545/g.191026  ORF Transcript_71545/g.191026 Transcript_71545/m.191026 type:complete len:102 (-) Transcript_71545:379-684(-)
MWPSGYMMPWNMKATKELWAKENFVGENLFASPRTEKKVWSHGLKWSNASLKNDLLWKPTCVIGKAQSLMVNVAGSLQDLFKTYQVTDEAEAMIKGRLKQC